MINVQAATINKAINNVEAPVKQKHVRSAIISTFQEQGGITFWSVVNKLPVTQNKIVAWKLCYIVHKILREGHPLCLVHSQKHSKDLEEIGNFWMNTRDDFGKMIKIYTQLLITKLEFHIRNPIFSGHLEVTHEEIESIGAKDINVYFQMVIEMFDYIDKILELKIAIFGSLDMSRANSVTNIGQCRLAPLIPCIQDASKLYEYCVQLLFKLHAKLPSDLLVGHRDRFSHVFKGLQNLYKSTNNLQYFKSFITVPILPKEPPNFLEVSQYSISVPENKCMSQKFESITKENFINTSGLNTFDEMPSIGSCSSILSQSSFDLISERDNLIKHLQMHSETLRTEISRMVNQHQKDISILEDKVIRLEIKLATNESELEQERQTKEDVFNHLSAVTTSQDVEQKIKEEKFNKIKDMYISLRKEHISLIMQKAETDKNLASINKKVLHLENEKHKLELKLREIENQSLAQRSVELELLKKDRELFNLEVEILKKALNDALKERHELNEKLKITMDENVQINTLVAELQKEINVLQNKIILFKKENSNFIRNMLSTSVHENEDIMTNAIKDIENAAIAGVPNNIEYVSNLHKQCLRTLEEVPLMDLNKITLCTIFANRITQKHSLYIILGMLNFNVTSSILFDNNVMKYFVDLGNRILRILYSLEDINLLPIAIHNAKHQLNMVSSLTKEINRTTDENLAAMIEHEITLMDKVTQEAANKIQDMLCKSREADSGIKLEVNEKILDSCTKLMQVIGALVQKAKFLQEDLVLQGKVTVDVKDFYKRNHKWTDGFISAANAVAVAAKFFVCAADKVVNGEGKFEELVVAAQEIAASTAQLVVASRVKAECSSKYLQDLTLASKNVTIATGGVIATVKDFNQLSNKSGSIDISNLTLHQAKRLEMEAQVRVLELEKELQQERLHLAALRRQHYQLTGDGEG